MPGRFCGRLSAPVPSTSHNALTPSPFVANCREWKPRVRMWVEAGGVGGGGGEGRGGAGAAPYVCLSGGARTWPLRAPFRHPSGAPPALLRRPSPHLFAGLPAHDLVLALSWPRPGRALAARDGGAGRAGVVGAEGVLVRTRRRVLKGAGGRGGGAVGGAGGGGGRVGAGGGGGLGRGRWGRAGVGVGDGGAGGRGDGSAISYRGPCRAAFVHRGERACQAAHVGRYSSDRGWQRWHSGHGLVGAAVVNSASGTAIRRYRRFGGSGEGAARCTP